MATATKPASNSASQTPSPTAAPSRAAPAWISVKDRLPEKHCYGSSAATNEGVLVSVRYTPPYEHTENEITGWVCRARLNWRGLWTDMDDETLTESPEGAVVTGWMPLPERQKGVR